MGSGFKLFFIQSLKQNLRNAQDLVPGIVFFVMLNTIFYLLFGLDGVRFSSLLPSLIWLAALLASIILGQSLFTEEHTSGHFAHWIMSPQNLPILFLAQIMACYLCFFIPICIFSALFGLIFSMTNEALIALLGGLLLGTWIMLLLAACIRILILSLPQASLIYPVLALPSYVPILVMGISAVMQATQGMNYLPYLALLGAYAIVITWVAPWVVTSILRVAHVNG